MVLNQFKIFQKLTLRVGRGAQATDRFTSSFVSRETLAWVVFAQGFAILPLFLHLPLWLSIIWASAVFTRIQTFRGVWPFPSTFIKLLFGISGATALYLSFGGRMGVEVMISFLLLSFVLKLIEMRNRIDVLIVLYIGFVTIAAHLLLSPTIWGSAYSLFTCGVLLAALRSVFQHRKVNVRERLWSGFSVLLQALPVMLILFLVMPRLGQLWAVPSMSESSKTGFSDSMSPGDISDLIESDEIVFRATFKNGPIPEPHQRYWRGLVLEQFDGRKWQRVSTGWMGRESGSQPAEKAHSKWGLITPSDSGTTFNYSVLLEPHHYQWMFTLMAPLEAYSPSVQTLFNEQVLLLSALPITGRTYYEVVSTLDYKLTPSALDERVRKRNLALPEKGNVQARAMAQEWVEDGLAATDIIERINDLYSQRFTYTLRPPMLGENSVDDFMFQTQRGFCEHFSSSFVFLARAAGIPARVVLGYQGGHYREEDRYIVVRQSDAHAWAEVWLEGSGWTRIDPTAAVSPLRIERALHEAVDSTESSLVGGAFLRIRALSWLADVRNRWEEFDYLWQTNVLGYDGDTQGGILQRLLGGTDPWRVALFFVGGIGGMLSLYYIWSFLRFKRPQQAPELRLLLAALRRLERYGIRRSPQETPVAFAQKVAKEKPALAPVVNKVVSLYCSIVYQPIGTDRKALIAQLRLESQKIR